MSEGDGPYEYHACFNHFHVTIGGDNLIGGKCDTEEEAREKVERLNAGEDSDDVLGTFWENVMEELPWMRRTPTNPQESPDE